MVSSDRPVSLEDEVSHSMKEMIGGCCVCSDERGWAENPLVYCDGHGCSVAVHQGKHPTARRAEPGLLPTVTASPTLAATASSPTAPPPAPPCPRPRLVPRPGIDSEGPQRGGGGVGCACGRKCVWPGLSCDSALTLSSVIWPPPAPGAVGLETFRGGGWRRGGGVGWGGGVRGRGLRPGGGGRTECAPFGGVAVAVGLGLGTWRPLPLHWLLLSAAVCLETSCGMESGSGMPLAAPGRVAEAEGWPWRFRLGREGATAAPPSFLAETLLLRTGSFLRRRRWPSAVAVVCCRSGLAELP